MGREEWLSLMFCFLGLLGCFFLGGGGMGVVFLVYFSLFYSFSFLQHFASCFCCHNHLALSAPVLSFWIWLLDTWLMLLNHYTVAIWHSASGWWGPWQASGQEEILVVAWTAELHLLCWQFTGWIQTFGGIYIAHLVFWMAYMLWSWFKMLRSSF